MFLVKMVVVPSLGKTFNSFYQERFTCDMKVNQMNQIDGFKCPLPFHALKHKKENDENVF